MILLSLLVNQPDPDDFHEVLEIVRISLEAKGDA